MKKKGLILLGFVVIVFLTLSLFLLVSGKRDVAVGDSKGLYERIIKIHNDTNGATLKVPVSDNTAVEFIITPQEDQKGVTIEKRKGAQGEESYEQVIMFGIDTRGQVNDYWEMNISKENTILAKHIKVEDTLGDRAFSEGFKETNMRVQIKETTKLLPTKLETIHWGSKSQSYQDLYGQILTIFSSLEDSIQNPQHH